MSCSSIFPSNVVVVLNFPEAMRSTRVVVLEWSITHPTKISCSVPVPVFRRHLQWWDVFQVVSDLLNFTLQIWEKLIHTILPAIGRHVFNLIIRPYHYVKVGARDMFAGLGCVGVGSWSSRGPDNGLRVGVNYVGGFSHVLKSVRLKSGKTPRIIRQLLLAIWQQTRSAAWVMTTPILGCWLVVSRNITLTFSRQCISMF